MGLIVKPNTFVPGTIIRSAEVNDNFDALYNEFNGNITNPNIHPNAGIEFSKMESISPADIIVGSAGGVPTPVPMTGDVTISDTGVTSISPTVGALVPIGSIIAHYDFNGLLTFNPAIWAYCDGSAVTISGIGLQTLPDLSNRYMVGFGTEGGGDIDTAAWAVPPVGNANHQTNLQHSHTVNAHTHTGPDHTHAAGTLVARIYMHHPNSGSTDGIYLESATTASWNATDRDDAGGSAAPPSGITDGTVVAGSTALGGTGATGSASPGTDLQLSTTESIQPRSIRVRYIMRIA